MRRFAAGFVLVAVASCLPGCGRAGPAAVKAILKAEERAIQKAGPAAGREGRAKKEGLVDHIDNLLPNPRDSRDRDRK